MRNGSNRKSILRICDSETTETIRSRIGSRYQNNRNTTQSEQSEVDIAHLRFRNNRRRNRKSISKQSEQPIYKHRAFAIPIQNAMKAIAFSRTINPSLAKTTEWRTRRQDDAKQKVVKTPKLSGISRKKQHHFVISAEQRRNIYPRPNNSYAANSGYREQKTRESNMVYFFGCLEEYFA